MTLTPYEELERRIHLLGQALGLLRRDLAEAEEKRLSITKTIARVSRSKRRLEMELEICRNSQAA